MDHVFGKADMQVMPAAASAAHRVAREAFAAMDPSDACRRTGAVFDAGSNCYLLPYMGQDVRVNASGCETQWQYPERVSHMDTMVVWHYLMHADGTKPSGQPLSLSQAAPSVSGWAARIQKNCIPPLAQTFGDDLPSFFRGAERLGGAQATDDTALFLLLPHIPIRVTIWAPDEEFPADARILLDSSIRRQLPQEDILVLPELLCYELLSASGKPFSMPGIGQFRPAR